MIPPIHHSQQVRPFDPVYSQRTLARPFSDQLVQMQANLSPIEWFQGVLRNLRDYLFDAFLSINPSLEQNQAKAASTAISDLEKAGSKKEKAAPIVNNLPQDIRRFVEIGIRRYLVNQTRAVAKQYPHASAFLEERPHAKEVVELLRAYVTSRKELVEISHLLPFVRNKTTLHRTLVDHFQQLSNPLRSKMLLALARIDGGSEKASDAKGKATLQDPLKTHLFRTTVAMAVCGLKTHEEPSVWHTQAWRCRFWYA